MAICAGLGKTRVPLQLTLLGGVSMKKSRLSSRILQLMWYGQIIQGHRREVRIVPLIFSPPLERVEDVLDRMAEVTIDLTDGCRGGDADREICKKQHTHISLN